MAGFKQKGKTSEKKPDEKKSSTNLPAAPAPSAVAGPIDYSADAGAGLEGADKDSYAIPFLLALQPLSPQVVDKTVAGAEAGMLMNSVSLELRKEAFFIP